LADIDLKVNFLVHRSIVTHGFLLISFLYCFARNKENPLLRLFTAGVSLASAVHLCFDLFPKAWIGFALIHIPGYGRTSPVFSWLWIAVSIVVCLYLALVLTRNTFEVVVTTSSLPITFGFYATTESVFWPALVVLTVATAVAVMLPLGSIVAFSRLRGKTAP